MSASHLLSTKKKSACFVKKCAARAGGSNAGAKYNQKKKNCENVRQAAGTQEGNEGKSGEVERERERMSMYNEFSKTSLSHEIAGVCGCVCVAAQMQYNSNNMIQLNEIQFDSVLFV